MGKNIDGLIIYSQNKKDTAITKVDEAINGLAFEGAKINFNTIAKRSGVSKNFLYSNEIIKSRIETLRNKQINHNINQRAKFDQTAKSKDVIIAAKDKRIAKLEEENTRLKLQLEFFQTRLYEK